MPMPSAYETRSEAFFRLYEGETPQEIQTLLTRWIPKGSRVLELACGSSRDARFMSGLGAIVEATDGNGPLLKLAEEGQSSGPPRRRVALLLPALPSSRQGFRRRTIRPSPPL